MLTFRGVFVPFIESNGLNSFQATRQRRENGRDIKELADMLVTCKAILAELCKDLASRKRRSGTPMT